jgi:hypothetical protein
MNHRNQIDPEFLEQRLRTIEEGLKEAIRREVARLRANGLPIYVSKNGRVVDINKKPDPDSRKGESNRPGAPGNADARG